VIEAIAVKGKVYERRSNGLMFLGPDTGRLTGRDFSFTILLSTILT